VNARLLQRFLISSSLDALFNPLGTSLFLKCAGIAEITVYQVLNLVCGHISILKWIRLPCGTHTNVSGIKTYGRRK